MRRRATFAGTLLCALLACFGGSDGGAFAPDSRVAVRVVNRTLGPVQIRFFYGSSTPSTLGTVAGGAEDLYRFRYNRAGDLRFQGDFIYRISGTSNPVDDLQPGDRLELTIEPSRELRLTKVR